jgi:RNA polymerase sigma-70 factor, ECF subfamily
MAWRGSGRMQRGSGHEIGASVARSRPEPKADIEYALQIGLMIYLWAVNKPPVAASTLRHVATDATEFADKDLVQAAKAGDRDAFRALFERYHRRVFAVALGVLRNPTDAQDVVQDGFVKAYRYLDKFEGNSSFYTWLYRIVMNLAIDHIRKHRRGRPVEANDEHLREGNTAVVNDDLLPLHLGTNPSRMLFDKQVRARLEQAMSSLSENHRAVLVMRELDGLSYEEMAAMMSCSKGTIMSRLFHARRNMQRQLIDLAPAGMTIDGADQRQEETAAAPTGKTGAQ